MALDSYILVGDVSLDISDDSVFINDIDTYLFVVGNANLLLDVTILQGPANFEFEVWEYDDGVRVPPNTAECDAAVQIGSVEELSNIELTKNRLYEFGVFLSRADGEYEVQLSFRQDVKQFIQYMVRESEDFQPIMNIMLLQRLVIRGPFKQQIDEESNIEFVFVPGGHQFVATCGDGIYTRCMRS